jgi:RNA polymerase sigma-70 factor (ECF subfamily)
MHYMEDFDRWSDEELTAFVRNDVHGAFAAIYHRYKAPLVIHASRKLGGNLEDAVEIIQEVFLNFWHNRHGLPEVVNLKAFLYVSVRNKVLNHIQHLKVVDRFADSCQTFALSQGGAADHLIREKQMVEIIEKEIESLPPKMKVVFLLSRKEHLTSRQIAEKLGISEFTVKNHIKSALKILRGRLGLALITMLFGHS